MKIALMTGLLLLALPLAAHDLYLVVDGNKVCARVGEHFPESMSTMPANRPGLWQARGAGAPAKLTGTVEEAKKQLCAPLPEKAPVVEMTVNPVFIRLQAKDFNGYIEGEGFKSVIAARKAKGATESEGRELYSRYTKLILPGAGAEGTKALGHVAEIVPEKSPDQLKAGEALPVRVMFRGKPLAGVRVSAVYAGAKLEGHTYPVNAETDVNGRAQLKLDRPGLWYARLIHMVPAENDPDIDWRSFFVTLTFEVPK